MDGEGAAASDFAFKGGIVDGGFDGRIVSDVGLQAVFPEDFCRGWNWWRTGTLAITPASAIVKKYAAFVNFCAIWTEACKERSGKFVYEEITNMLWTVFVVLVLLLLLGLDTSYSLGGMIQVLLVFAVAIPQILLLQGRRAV